MQSNICFLASCYLSGHVCSNALGTQGFNGVKGQVRNKCKNSENYLMNAFFFADSTVRKLPKSSLGTEKCLLISVKKHSRQSKQTPTVRVYLTANCRNSSFQANVFFCFFFGSSLIFNFWLLFHIPWYISYNKEMPSALQRFALWRKNYSWSGEALLFW